MLSSVVVVLCVVFLLAGIGLILAWTELGKRAEGHRLSRMKLSPNYMKGKFQNPIPTDNSFGVSKLIKTLRDYSGNHTLLTVSR